MCRFVIIQPKQAFLKWICQVPGWYEKCWFRETPGASSKTRFESWNKRTNTNRGLDTGDTSEGEKQSIQKCSDKIQIHQLRYQDVLRYIKMYWDILRYINILGYMKISKDIISRLRLNTKHARKNSDMGNELLDSRRLKSELGCSDEQASPTAGSGSCVAVFDKASAKGKLSSRRPKWCRCKLHRRFFGTELLRCVLDGALMQSGTSRHHGVSLYFLDLKTTEGPESTRSPA